MASKDTSRLTGWSGPFWRCEGARELFDHYVALCHYLTRDAEAVAAALVRRTVKGPHEGHFSVKTEDGYVWAYQADIPLSASKMPRISILFPATVAFRDKPVSFYVKGEAGEDDIVDLIGSLLAEAKKMLGEEAPDLERDMLA